jgi:hypothetical protein
MSLQFAFNVKVLLCVYSGTVVVLEALAMMAASLLMLCFFFCFFKVCNLDLSPGSYANKAQNLVKTMPKVVMGETCSEIYLDLSLSGLYRSVPCLCSEIQRCDWMSRSVGSDLQGDCTSKIFMSDSLPVGSRIQPSKLPESQWVINCSPLTN